MHDDDGCQWCRGSAHIVTVVRRAAYFHFQSVEGVRKCTYNVSRDDNAGGDGDGRGIR